VLNTSIMHTYRRIYLLLGWVAGIVYFTQSCIIAHAHELNTSYTTILISSKRFYLTEGFDLSQITDQLSLDKNSDDTLTRDELSEGLILLYQYVEDHLEISLDGAPLKLLRKEDKFTRDDIENLIPKEGFLLKAKRHEVIKLTWTQLHDGSAEKLSLKIGFFKDFGRNHKNLVRFMGQEESVIAVLSPEEPETQFAVK